MCKPNTLTATPAAKWLLLPQKILPEPRKGSLHDPPDGDIKC